MQIDPAALSRPDSAATTITSSKGSATSAPALQKSTKALIAVPRLDLEPVYTELKAAIADHWAEYKEATTLFLLGEFDMMKWTPTLNKYGLWLSATTFSGAVSYGRIYMTPHLRLASIQIARLTSSFAEQDN